MNSGTPPDNDLPSPRRRSLLLGAAGALTLPLWRLAFAGDVLAASTPAQTTGARLPPWRPGQMDIHHLAIGRGNATLIVMPDGTSVLVDAGATNDGFDVSMTTRPGTGRRPGEWIARYAARHLAATGHMGLDYALVTHLHPDHLGDVSPSSPLSQQGDYRLTGIMDVAEALPIGVLIDRGYPDYPYLGGWLETAPFAKNYRSFIESRRAHGGVVEAFQVGRRDQFRPLGRIPVKSPFGIRNIAANGRVWSGDGTNSHELFPPRETLAPSDLPDENMLCAAIRVEHGAFRYFTGGDLTSTTFDGDEPWRDILTAAARAAGRVDVATADHHGLYDAVSADVVRALRPRAWIIQAWHISHPSMLPLEHMLSERLYPGPRDIFATDVMSGNALMHQRLIKRLRSTRGHVVVRVDEGGANFRVFVTDNRSEDDRVLFATDAYSAGMSMA